MSDTDSGDGSNIGTGEMECKHLSAAQNSTKALQVHGSIIIVCWADKDP